MTAVSDTAAAYAVVAAAAAAVCLLFIVIVGSIYAKKNMLKFIEQIQAMQSLVLLCSLMLKFLLYFFHVLHN